MNHEVTKNMKGVASEPCFGWVICLHMEMMRDLSVRTRILNTKGTKISNGMDLPVRRLYCPQITLWNQALVATMHRGVLSDRERLLNGGRLIRCQGRLWGFFFGGHVRGTSDFRIDGLRSGEIFRGSVGLAEFLVRMAAVEER